MCVAVPEPAPLFAGAESSRCGRIHAVPSRQPGSAPLAEVRLGAGGAPEFMAFQGRATSALGRGLPRTAADAGTMLDGMALCIGLAREAEVNMARQHAKYREYVEPFDGGGVHEYNDEHALPHDRWKPGGPWQKKAARAQRHGHGYRPLSRVHGPRRRQGRLGVHRHLPGLREMAADAEPQLQPRQGEEAEDG